MSRPDGRSADQLRSVTVTRRYTSSAPGSVLLEMGRTKVLCTATVEHAVPPWLEGRGQGWVTAEYGMLPASTRERKPRERSGRTDGRSSEIQRLIGRALRGVMDLEMLGERTIWLDCDVLEADGGTRAASVTGAYVALVDALRALEQEGLKFPAPPLRDSVAAVSVGVVQGENLLDLCYEEDARAEVDLNVVLTGRDLIVEVQGTAERTPFDVGRLLDLYALARKGIARLREIQQQALAD